MHSRAHLLIEKQMKILSAEKPWGVTATLLNPNSMFEWVAKIEAFSGSTWEGGVFQVHVKFDEHYSARPPSVYFHTIPFHPNVDMSTGRPCIDFLDDWSKWNPNYTITSLLLTLQTLLSNPVLDDAVNPDAVRMMLDSPRTYLQVVQDCIKASQRVAAGLAAYKTEEEETLSLHETITKEELNAAVPLVRRVQERVAKLSFENYYRTWCMIATSQNKNCQPVIGSERSDDLTIKDKKPTDIAKRPQSHEMTKSKPQAKVPAQDSKLARIQQMRKIYLQPQNTPHRNVESQQKDEEPWETEVDDLVNWSAKLNEKML